MKKRKHGQQTIPRPTKKQERRGIVIPAPLWARVQAAAKVQDVSASKYMRMAAKYALNGGIA